MQLDQADQYAAGAFGMNEGVATARVAERLPDQLPAGRGNLRTGVVEILHLKADVVQAGASTFQELAQLRLRPERADDLEANSAIAFEIICADILRVNFLEPGGLDAEQGERAFPGLELSEAAQDTCSKPLILIIRYLASGGASRSYHRTNDAVQRSDE